MANDDWHASESASAAGSDTRSWLGDAQRYPRGIELFQQGAALAEIMYVRAGLVKILSADVNGHESILGLVFANEWLGTAPIIARLPSPVTAITCDDSWIVRISAAAFRERLHSDPALSDEIHRMHAAALCRHLSWIGQLGSLNARQRLEIILGRLVRARPQRSTPFGTTLDLPLHNWELASLVGITPEHLSRLLTELQRQGVIRREKGWIVVADVSRLEARGDLIDVKNGLDGVH